MAFPPRPSTLVWTPDMDAVVRAAASQNDAARRLKLHKRQVRRRWVQLGRVVLPRGAAADSPVRRKWSVRAALDLRRDGATLAQVGARFGVSAQAVCKALQVPAGHARCHACLKPFRRASYGPVTCSAACAAAIQEGLVRAVLRERGDG